MTSIQRETWVKGQGFHEHYHRYEHPFTVIEGVVMVQHGGRTRKLEPGGSLIHKIGKSLKAWAVSERAVIETDHSH